MARLNIAFCDESAYIAESIIKEVIIPMLIVAPDYQVGKTAEERRNNKLLLASTASYRVNWLYKTFCEWTRNMTQPDNKDYYTLTLPWQVGVRCGLHKEDFIMQQKATMNSDKFDMEYNGIFPKLIGGVWISYEDIMKCSDLAHIEITGRKEFEYLVSIDVARTEGSDNSIVNVFKLRWYSDHVELDLVYVKSMNGMTFSEQAKEIRTIHKLFPNTVRMVMDTNGLGVGLSDELARDYYDEDTDIWHQPLLDMNNKEQMEKMKSGALNGNPIIYGIKATAEINHNMGMAIKTYTQKHWLHLYPMSADENRKVDLSIEEEKQLLEAEETRMEVLNIKNRPIVGSIFVKFYSKSRRKDRWSSLCMGIYGAQKLYEERNNKDDTEIDFFVGVSSR